MPQRHKGVLWPPFTEDLLMSNSKTLRALSPLIIASIILMGCEAAQTEAPAVSDQVMTNEIEVEDKDPHDTEMVLIMLVMVGLLVAFPSLRTTNCDICPLINS